MSSDRFALAVAAAMFAAGLLGLVLHRVLPEHHTTGGSRDMIGAIVGLLTLSVRPGHGPSDLDGVRRVLRPKHADSGSGVESHAARPCARRLWAGGQRRARAAPRGVGEDHRSSLGRERERQQFRSEQLRRGAREHAGPGKGPGRSSSPRPTSKSGRSPLRHQRPTRSLRRECRCPSRSPLPFPIRFC